MESFDYEWDEAKRLANIERHGVDFMAVRWLDWSCAIILSDRRRDYGEPRRIAYGPIGERLYAVVFTDRASSRRIISIRKANRREQAAYQARLRGR
jgi:uncharacterized protein